MPKPPAQCRQFAALLKIVEDLRGPNGCPWDKEQTHHSLTQYAIEEAYELAEAIDTKSDQHLIEELGDVLLQVVLHSEIARQDGRFTVEDVIESICKKMIRRHPHVFGDKEVSGTQEVMKNWAQIKAEEKKQTTERENIFNVPRNLPALIRSQKIGDKTKRLNFDWENASLVFAKIEEEVAELKKAMDEMSQVEQQHEVGDLLFSVVQLARHLNFDAEQSLRLCNSRFETRFSRLLELVKKDGKEYSTLTHNDLEAYYSRAKEDLAKG